MLTYSPQFNTFAWTGPELTRSPPVEAGFEWSPVAKRFYTRSPYIAYLLRGHADSEAQKRLARIDFNVSMSKALEPILPGQKGLMTFQAAGVAHMADQLRAGRKAVLLADEQGTGKTIQSIALANTMGYKRLLVICPATGRLNWAREIQKWHQFKIPVTPILNGKQKIPSGHSVTISYNLLTKNLAGKFDFIIVDEAHYIKNFESPNSTKNKPKPVIRTQMILGNGKNWRGLVDNTPTIFLAGTPVPNGKPNEMWPILFRTAPDVIDHLRYFNFQQRFCILQDDGNGGYIVRGAKRQPELFARLRGSGFMTRRLKKDVLTELPPKRYKMVVFPQDRGTRTIIKKEAQFNADEIIKHGVPAGSVLPELRREMGMAKLPQAVEYVTDLLEGGCDKVIVFVHHREVAAQLGEALDKYKPATIVGATSAKNRDIAVDRFQTEPGCRVFIGNEAAEELITLTAAADVVLAEPEWVPGKNEQRADRAHRIGQLRGVIVHILVVEGSLDAKILSSAAFKALDSQKILDEEVTS